MDSSASPTFPCPQCGKKLKWNPAIAGKTGRCSCGAAVRAPESVAQPTAPANPDNDLYDLAPGRQVTIPTASIAMPPPLPGQSVIGYRGAPPIPADGSPPGNSLNLFREIYIPVVVLVLGFVGIVAVLGFEGDFFGRAVVPVIFISGTIMVIKTAILTFLAWAFATQSGRDVGNPMPFVLKVAGLIIFLDAAILWVWAAMHAAGADMTSRGFVSLAMILIMLVVTVLAAAIVVRGAYGLRGDQAKYIGRFVAFGNLIMNLIIVAGVLIILTAITTAKHKARAATAAAQQAIITAAQVQAQTQAQASQPQVITSLPSASPTVSGDRPIAARIARGDPFVLEGHQWQQTHPSVGKDRLTSNLVDQLYNAGAQRVYVDVFGPIDAASSTPRPKIYVELPPDEPKRSACVDTCHAYQQQHGLDQTPVDDSALGRYLVIELKR